MGTTSSRFNPPYRNASVVLNKCLHPKRDGLRQEERERQIREILQAMKKRQ